MIKRTEELKEISQEKKKGLKKLRSDKQGTTYMNMEKATSYEFKPRTIKIFR